MDILIASSALLLAGIYTKSDKKRKRRDNVRREAKFTTALPRHEPLYGENIYNNKNQERVEDDINQRVEAHIRDLNRDKEVLGVKKLEDIGTFAAFPFIEDEARTLRRQKGLNGVSQQFLERFGDGDQKRQKKEITPFVDVLPQLPISAGMDALNHGRYADTMSGKKDGVFLPQQQRDAPFDPAAFIRLNIPKLGSDLYPNSKSSSGIENKRTTNADNPMLSNAQPLESVPLVPIRRKTETIPYPWSITQVDYGAARGVLDHETKNRPKPRLFERKAIYGDAENIRVFGNTEIANSTYDDERGPVRATRYNVGASSEAFTNVDMHPATPFNPDIDLPMTTKETFLDTHYYHVDAMEGKETSKALPQQVPKITIKDANAAIPQRLGGDERPVGAIPVESGLRKIPKLALKQGTLTTGRFGAVGSSERAWSDGKATTHLPGKLNVKEDIALAPPRQLQGQYDKGFSKDREKEETRHEMSKYAFLHEPTTSSVEQGLVKTRRGPERDPKIVLEYLRQNQPDFFAGRHGADPEDALDRLRSSVKLYGRQKERVVSDFSRFDTPNMPTTIAPIKS